MLVSPIQSYSMSRCVCGYRDQRVYAYECGRTSIFGHALICILISIYALVSLVYTRQCIGFRKPWVLWMVASTVSEDWCRNIRVCMRMQAYAHAHTNTHKHIHAHICTQTYTQTHTQTHVHTRTHTHTQLDSQTRTHTQTDRETYKCECIHSWQKCRQHTFMRSSRITPNHSYTHPHTHAYPYSKSLTYTCPIAHRCSQILMCRCVCLWYVASVSLMCCLRLCLRLRVCVRMLVCSMCVCTCVCLCVSVCRLLVCVHVQAHFAKVHEQWGTEGAWLGRRDDIKPHFW